ncbi:MAG: hypothetical protein Q9223_001183 [Gallowayella weberi]
MYLLLSTVRLLLLAPTFVSLNSAALLPPQRQSSSGSHLIIPVTLPGQPDCIAVYKPAVLKTRFCSVPGTTTSLAINYEVTKTFPFAMREVITAAQKQIRKRIDGGDPNRRLLPSEEPFRVQEWGLVIEAESLEGEHLTWKLLLDAMDGLFLCALDRDHRNLLKAQIRVANRSRAATKGWLYLKMAYSKDVARKN